MLINRDQENAHKINIEFHDLKAGGKRSFTGPVSVITFGSAQYQWHPRNRAASPIRMAQP
jgi:hypothetical protein